MKVTKSITNGCFVLGGNTMRVFAGRWGTPIDGVVRNVAFKNTATGTTIQSPCAVPTKPNAVLFLSSIKKDNKPMVLGLNGWSISHILS